MAINESYEQAKICEKVFINIEDRFKVANHRIDDLENKSEELNNMGKVLVELQLLTSLQREDGIKRDKMIEVFSENQIKISNALDGLTNKLNNTDINVEKLTEKVDGMSQDNSINISKLIKNFIIGLIGTGAGLGLAQLIK